MKAICLEELSKVFENFFFQNPPNLITCDHEREDRDLVLRLKSFYSEKTTFLDR